ncbi:hypothetical protein ACOMHN_013381 [Nucella lapillus]
MMKKSKAKKVLPDMEPDFTQSRAGLSTHRKNTAEQHRLEDKLRSLDILQRRSSQKHRSEERSIMQSLPASHGLRPPGTSSRWGEDDSWPTDFSCSSSSSRASLRGPLQQDPSGSVKDGESSGGGHTGRRSRRPSIVLQEVSSQPVIDVSEDTWASNSDPDHDTIIDMLAARNRPRNARRASVGGAAGLGADLNLHLLSNPLTDHQDSNNRRQRSSSGDRSDASTPRASSSSTPTPDHSPVSPLSSDNNPTEGRSPKVDSPGMRRPRRASVSTAMVDHEPLLHRPKEGPARAEGVVDRRASLPARDRRCSVDVGATSISLLSPGLPLSRVASRRSSLASSQGTPSSPSTPDPESKMRDVTSFAFPPVTTTPSSTKSRHSYDVRPSPLVRRHSSDTLLMSPTAGSRHHHGHGHGHGHGHAHGHVTSQGNSSLKLPRMQGRRKSVVPCVNNMLLLHSVLQNSSSFKAADFQEGSL